MSYEAFREQCANIVYKSENKFVAEARINALPLPDDMPLPEVKQEQIHARICEYEIGTWFEARTIEEMSEFYMSRLPAIRDAAGALGYAIGVHGSTKRDFDLIAMQWVDNCADHNELAHAISKAACGIMRSVDYEWEKKPRGRIATSIPICWTDHSSNFDKNALGLGHIDLSIMLLRPDIEALCKERDLLRLAMIKCEQEADFALKQVSQSKIYAAVTEIKRLLKSALKGNV